MRRRASLLLSITIGLGLPPLQASLPASAQEARPESEPREPLPAEQVEGLPARESLRYEGEEHFGVIRRLTTLGENAEGYLSFAGDRLVYQATVPPYDCDQIFLLDLLTGERELVSTGTGRTTCAYFLKGDREIVFASTHAADPGCLQPPDYSQGYVWKIYPEYDIWKRNLDSGELTRLTDTPGYDAEATVSPNGEWMIYTSMRSGDLDLWVRRVGGTEDIQLTRDIGYDGGAFFSPDSGRIVWRSFYPETQEAAERYQDLLAQDTIEPMALQIMVADFSPDGLTNVTEVTQNDAANFGPFWHPDGERIIYSSNQASASGRDFDLFIIGVEGARNRRVTYCPSFDGFPMFTADGKRLVFASNRSNRNPRDTNLFIAEWVEPDLRVEEPPTPR